jgi:hypothetical protein
LTSKCRKTLSTGSIGISKRANEPAFCGHIQEAAGKFHEKQLPMQAVRDDAVGNVVD